MRFTMPTRRRLIAAVAITATAALALTGCSGAAGGAGTSGSQKPTVVINQAVQTLFYLPLYVAMEKGYFTDAGVAVKLDTAGSGNGAFAAVLGGSAGFSIQDPVFVPKSHQQGGEGTVVTGVANAAGLFIVGKDGTSVQDDTSKLNGKSIVVSPSPDSTWALMTSMIKEDGLKNVKLVNVTLGNELAAVASGRADYAVVGEPAVSAGVAEQGLHVDYSWGAAGDRWNPFAFSSLTSTQKYVKAHPKETQAVVTAFQRADEFIYANPGETKTIAKKYFPKLAGSTVDTAVERNIDANLYPHDALVTETAWAHNMGLAASIKNVDGYPTDATKYSANVDTTFAKKAIAAYPAK
jgi:NitT/TauT family transport system substrate-binding protein